MSGPAFAADLSLKDTPEYEVDLAPIWTGLYIGGHVGGAWGDTDVTDVFVYEGDPLAKNSFSTSGVIAGVQLGYNLQSGNIVYGIEADLGYLNLSGKKSAALNPDDFAYNRVNGTYSLSGGLYGDLTARLGYTTDKALFYVKGGAAFLNANLKSHYEGENCLTLGGCWGWGAGPSTFDFENDEMLLGWTLGLGVEYALSPGWSLKLEYQHFDFGTMASNYEGSYSFLCRGWGWGPGECVSNLSGRSETSITADAVTVGLNYQFGNGEGDTLK